MSEVKEIKKPIPITDKTKIKNGYSIKIKDGGFYVIIANHLVRIEKINTGLKLEDINQEDIECIFDTRGKALIEKETKI